MKTEVEPDNKYTSDLKRYGADLCAETLLGLMRVDVEKIFARHGLEQPPSQSHRAATLLDEVNKEIQAMVKAKHPLDSDLTLLFRERNMLKDFLSVHRTVWLLEGKPI